jgi:hypothetical protein
MAKFEDYINEVSGIQSEIGYKIKENPKDVAAEVQKVLTELKKYGIKPDLEYKFTKTKIILGDTVAKKTKNIHKRVFFGSQESFGGAWNKTKSEYEKLVDLFRDLPNPAMMDYGPSGPKRMLKFIDDIQKISNVIKANKNVLEKYYLMRVFYDLMDKALHVIQRGDD